MFVNIIFMLFIETFAEMGTEDVCSQKADHGGCRSILVRWYFNKEQNRCERFIFGGCAGNQNNFVSEELCQRHCLPKLRTDDVCNQPIYSGPCRAYFKRFWFNNETRKCEEFIYGGCDEKANNFQTAEACVKTCGAVGVELRKPNKTKRSDKNAVCELPPERGSCSNFTSRYYFNNTMQRCEKFVFSGCGGNDNSFKSLKLCRSVCKSIKSPVTLKANLPSKCKLPKRVGFCRGRFERFYFNVNSHSCEQFFYGGCLGNANNFKSLEKCEEACAY